MYVCIRGLYACMYVCMYVCLFCMHIRIHTSCIDNAPCMCMRTYVCIWISSTILISCTGMRVHLGHLQHTKTHTHTRTQRTYINPSSQAHTYVHTYIHTHTHAHIIHPLSQDKPAHRFEAPNHQMQHTPHTHTYSMPTSSRSLKHSTHAVIRGARTVA